MQLILNSPLDMHLHLREGEMLKQVAPLSAETFSGAVIMPNLLPPITSLKRLSEYENEIKAATDGCAFDPYLTMFLTDYSEAELLDIKDKVIALKLYPAGATTNSDGGIEDINKADKTLRVMEELGIPLSVHGETVKNHILEREKEFLPVYRMLAEKYPKLKIIMEHITTKDSIELLGDYENLFATVTLQHLMITFDDIYGALMNPHLYCKPIAKTFEDRDALKELVFSSNPKVMFGSDSAPHYRGAKEVEDNPAAGCFTAPVILPCLAELFDENGVLDKLQAFISDNAQQVYGVKPVAKKVTLTKESFVIPEEYHGIVPIFSGKEVSWNVTNIE